MKRRWIAHLLCLALGFSVFACRGGSSNGRAPDTGVPVTPPETSAAAQVPTGPDVEPRSPGQWAGPIVQRSAPKAPARVSSFACAPPKRGAKRYYPRDGGNECIMRGGRVKVQDSPELKAAGHHPVAICEDDDCTSDATCGADRICACAPADSKNAEDHNRCIFGNCTSDADCGGFACADTLALGIPAQPKGVYAVFGRYCRSNNDTCKTDQGCANFQQGERCIYTDGSFHCRMPR